MNSKTMEIPAKDWNAEKGKMEDTSLPEWTRYYEAYERWKASRSSYPNEMEWWMAEPNKPGYFRANND